MQASTVIKLPVTEREFWDSGLCARLCDVDEYVGCHSEQPYGENGYVHNPVDPAGVPEELPDGDYQLVVVLDDERYTFYFSNPEGLFKARKILREECNENN